MWNRAPRTDPFCASKLYANISPASYNPFPLPKRKPCHVPFNCSTNALALADTGVPAPCTYNIRYRKHRIKGGASLRFTSPRVTFSRKPGPSPLSYDPDLLYGQKYRRKTKGKIYRGKPPRYGYTPSVSIPPKLFDGFDIIKGEGLILRPPRIDFRKRIEPKFRHFPYELNSTTLKYKGNQWSKLRAKRKLILAGDPDSPGVGTYNLIDKPLQPLDVYLTTLRANKKREKVSPSKWNDIKYLMNVHAPGPGTYEINYEPLYGLHSFNVIGTLPRAERFKTENIVTMQQPLELRPPPTITSKQKAWPPFNCSSDARPNIPESDTSPAKICVYNDNILYNLVKKLISAPLIVPFGSTSERPSAFIPNDHPGPGTYDLRPIFLTIHVGLGEWRDVTDRLTDNNASRHLDMTPSPDEDLHVWFETWAVYIKEKEKPKRTIYGVRDRNTYIPPIKLTPLRVLLGREVAPWTYDLSHGIKTVYGRKDCHKGPTWIKEKEFNRTKWAIKDSPDALYNPKDVRALHCGQPIFSKRPKPKEKEVTPGPADYHIHPLFTEACLRAHMTQNATSDLQYVKYFNPKPVGGNSVRYI